MSTDYHKPSLSICHQRIRLLLRETIKSLCSNTLSYNASISVEGLLGITLDEKEVFLVNINECVQDTKFLKRKTFHKSENFNAHDTPRTKDLLSVNDMPIRSDTLIEEEHTPIKNIKRSSEMVATESLSQNLGRSSIFGELDRVKIADNCIQINLDSEKVLYDQTSNTSSVKGKTEI